MSERRDRVVRDGLGPPPTPTRPWEKKVLTGMSGKKKNKKQKTVQAKSQASQEQLSGEHPQKLFWTLS